MRGTTGDAYAAGAARLSRVEVGRYLLLGAPALGLGLAATTLSAYLPIFAHELTRSHLLIGTLVATQGLAALVLPVGVGAASDRLRTRLGGRLPILMATAPIAAVALVVAPFGRTILVLALAALGFFVAETAYYVPYRAMYSDLVPRAHSGRAQGVQGVFRGAGTGAALVGGALLLQAWRPLPFAVAAAVLLATTIAMVAGVRGNATQARRDATAAATPRSVWTLLREYPDIRRFMLCNVLWQSTEAGLKSFVVLYLRPGLHQSLGFSAGAMAVAAGAALVAAPLAGKLADRYGAARVMRILLAVFGVGLWIPTFSRSTAVLLSVLPVVGMGGAMALSLPYAILMKVMPRGSHGATAGLFDLSGGAGTLLGPLITGAAIDALAPAFAATGGYAAMWPVIGTAALLSIGLLRVHELTDLPPAAS
jgi:MFS family permease